MAYTTINKSSLNFNTKPYTGDGTTSNTITGIGFQSDMVWFKARSTTDSHFLTDIVRGITKYIRPSATNAEETETTAITSLTSDGYVLSTAGNVNDNNVTYASWNWKAGSSFSNSAGANGASIASTGSVNTAAGFSIISYTGNGASSATLAHGLGAVPKMMIVKRRDASASWFVYHHSIGANNQLKLDNTEASSANQGAWNNTAPTSSLFTIGTADSVNANNGTYIAYIFADVQGYSKMASYSGNNDADGTFVYTGFSPAFIMVKKTSASGNGWQLRDNKRTPYGNETTNLMYASANSAEQTTDGFDFLSNGFKWRNQAGDCNANASYIYMAFGQSLVGTNNVPATAR